MTTRTCTFPGCGRKIWGHGYCNSHLAQLRAGKTLHKIGVKPVPVEFRGPREQGPWTGDLRLLMAGAPRWSGKHGSHS